MEPVQVAGPECLCTRAPGGQAEAAEALRALITQQTPVERLAYVDPQSEEELQKKSTCSVRFQTRFMTS